MKRVEIYVHYMIQQSRNSYSQEKYVHIPESIEKKKKSVQKKLAFKKKWFLENFDLLVDKYDIKKKFALETYTAQEIYTKFLSQKKQDFNINLYDTIQLEFEYQKVPKRIVTLDY